MNKILLFRISTFAVFFFCIFSLFGQSFEKSLSISDYKVFGNRISYGVNTHNKVDFNYEALMFNGSLGFNFPVFSPDKDFTLGINTTLQVGAMVSSNSSYYDNKIILDFGLPITATIRYGAGSNRNAQAPVGIGLGLGGRINSVMADGDVFMKNKDALFYSFIKPYAFLEVLFDFQKRSRSFFDNFKIQFSMSPKVSTTYYDSDSKENYGSNTTYFNVSFIKFEPFN